MDAETGFGTGLRGKLKKRQEPEAPEANGTAPVAEEHVLEGDPIAAEPSPPSPPPASPLVAAPSIADTAELDALRAELAAALDRERDLRIELAAS